MAFNPTLLDTPIDRHAAGLAGFLDKLQGNILKGHGRNNTLNSIFDFAGADPASIKAAIRTIGAAVLSAKDQLRDAAAFRAAAKTSADEPIDAGPVVFFFLTAAGYRWLDLEPPGDPSFRDGMAAHEIDLADPAQGDWFEHWRNESIHAMLLVGDDDVNRLGATSTPLEQALIAAGAVRLGRDAGEVLRIGGNAQSRKGEGIEHFGYVDGVSQPLMLEDEIVEQKPIALFAVAPAMAAVVPDPHGGSDEAYGSYLVYRRLDQNVRGFKTMEGGLSPNGSPGNLATAMGLINTPTDPEARELAGAMVVGRFEDGTPVTLSKTANGGTPMNQFDYAADPDGNRCPFQGHIRKTNPRNDEPERLMPRRGIPYGERAPDSFEDLAEMPTGGVGLLFMAYNADIGRQFEFVQKLWANNPDFPFPATGPGVTTGIDPVIGQGPPTSQDWPAPYDTPGRIAFSFGGFVTMTGGAYFFAPSIPFLKTLGSSVPSAAGGIPAGSG